MLRYVYDIVELCYAELSTESWHRITDGHRIGAGAHSSRASQVKQHADFAEVLFRIRSL